jgi:hypothetical protein
VKKKVLFHYNVPFDIHIKALKHRNYNEGIFLNSTFASGLRKGFIRNNYEFQIEFVSGFFLNRRFFRSKLYYKIVFSIYNKIFGFIDNYFECRRIYNKIKREEINLYFTELNPIVTKRFLKKLKLNSIRTIQWFGVFPNTIGFNNRPLKTTQFFDLTVSTANILDKFKAPPKKFLEIFPVSDEINPKEIYENSHFEYDIIFIGSLSKLHSNRWDFLEFIYDNFQSFVIYGYKSEDVPKKYKFLKNYKGSVWGQEYYKKLKSSKIIINLFLDGYEKLESGMNLRIVESLSRKNFVLTQYQNSLKKYFELDSEIATFKNLDDLKEKINLFLNDKYLRKKFIDKGYERIKHFSYENQIRKILEY